VVAIIVISIRSLRFLVQHFLNSLSILLPTKCMVLDFDDHDLQRKMLHPSTQTTLLFKYYEGEFRETVT
jgi:hypothetical protein